MPQIYDNIDSALLPALRVAITSSYRGDFSVGYFNLRGWEQVGAFVDQWQGGEGNSLRLLVGMHRPESEEWRQALKLGEGELGLDLQTVAKYKRELAEEFRIQLTRPPFSSASERALRKLVEHVQAKKVQVRLFLEHPLHAKLYMLHRNDAINPMIGYVGSSNLTFAGLKGHGELNVELLDRDTCSKLAQWFDERWSNRWCVDITDVLVEVIEQSWARHDAVSPYHIYLKIAYHLSREARAGLNEFPIPREMQDVLFKYQSEAIRIAASHLHKKGGVLIGDVVGLGKTLMASAIAKVFEDTLGRALIICPRNLEPMWLDYCERYDLSAKVIRVSKVTKELPHLRRYRLIIIDESHNLRNAEGKRFRAIQSYIAENESRCLLLSATPYNKTYIDLSNQLALFLPRDRDIGIRPENLIRERGGVRRFEQAFQCAARSLAAFEKSEHADDWRELMRLYMVRRTRSFIKEVYASVDEQTGRRYLTLGNGTRSYFPDRIPRTVAFRVDDKRKTDQYAKLYADDVVDTINALHLSRYGLGNYMAEPPSRKTSSAEKTLLSNLGRAGKRLMGFSRTNLFKRLESSGHSFLQSIERHVVRNYVYLHAIDSRLDLPIGTLDAGMLDASSFDEDADAVGTAAGIFDDDDADERNEIDETADSFNVAATEKELRNRAALVYDAYARHHRGRFKWIAPDLFDERLAHDLVEDAHALLGVLKKTGEWVAKDDAKLNALIELLTKKHPTEKVLVFSQFADTVRYLVDRLSKAGMARVEGATGQSADPTALAWRFSPVSNDKRSVYAPESELRVLIATDVLSEGQNLQDCAIVVNYDLPWAIIRLIQRAGRVDRIGQHSEKILVYSFLPAEGVERIIRLRQRVRLRLSENAEVVGTDERFFEGDDQATILDLYNERSEVLDRDEGEVDLASRALQIWESAIAADPELKEIVPALEPVVHGTKPYRPKDIRPEGVLVYLRTAEANDALVWMNRDGESVTESQVEILAAAECAPDIQALERFEEHYDLVDRAISLVALEERNVGGQLGKQSSARRRVYERLKDYQREVAGRLFDTPELRSALDDIYRFPLTDDAQQTLNTQMRSGINDDLLAELVVALRDEGRLSRKSESDNAGEPQIICSMGLRASD